MDSGVERVSYARFTYDSDVYVFYSVDHMYECCGCCLRSTSFCCGTAKEMIEHLEQHRVVGHKVPEYALERLRQDVEEADDV